MTDDASAAQELDLYTVAHSIQGVQALLSQRDLPEDSKCRLLNCAYLQAASNNRIELLEHLLTDTEARRHIDLNAVDEDGTPALILAAFSGFGEVVRALLEHSADVNVRDARGWTALMWAFQTNNFPLSSFLINRRASPTLRSHNGLAAIDLIRKGPAGDVYRSVLHDFHEQEDIAQAINGDGQSVHSVKKQPCRRASVASLPGSPSMRSVRLSKQSGLPRSKSQAQLVQEKEQQTKVELAIESAQILQIDYALLDIETGQDTDRGALPTMIEADESQAEESLPAFNWEECQSEQMLAFSYQDLPAILDLATETKPSRRNDVRFMPANVIFLAARYASRYAGEDLLGELMIGAIDRIEASIHLHPEDLANSAFWLSNSILLLYYLRRDPHTADNTIEYQDNLHDLIREIFVFCIRDTERRLDKLLDAAILEHEALPGFDDIRFEGEWRFVKALTSRSKKDSSFPSASGLGGTPSRPSVLGLFASPDRSTSMSTSQNTPLNKLVSPRTRAPSMPDGRIAGNGSPGLSQPPVEMSPRSVTALLSATLFVLQHYDYAGHPCIVVQAFSQLLYWMASELFNRILSKKRYICRSRAVQIRLSISSLEDWARVNNLPTQMVQAHFRPLNELLQWLQCLSSESSIDGLLGTMQNLRTLNPVQMRKAVKEYRYEVEETRMSEECAQYLAQLQKDWERRRLLQGVQEAEEEQAREAYASANSSQLSISLSDGDTEDTQESSRTSDTRTQVERHIDEVFGEASGNRCQTYEPPARPECFNELLDSRAMLPFALPTSNEALLHFRKEAIGPSSKTAASNNDNPSQSTPVIRGSSMQSSGSTWSSQGGSTELSPSPALPDNFLLRLKEAQSRYYAEEVPHLRIPRQHQRSVSGTSALGQDDHWTNWRERMEQEIAQAEDETD